MAGLAARERLLRRASRGACIVAACALAMPGTSQAAEPKTEAPSPVPASPAPGGEADGRTAQDHPPGEPFAAAQGGIDAIILPVQLVIEHGKAPPGVARQREQVDALLTDTAQDLGLTVNLGERPSADEYDLDEQSLAELAKRQGKLTVLPILRIGAKERKEGLIELRVVVARPGTRALVARVERVAPEDLSVRAAVMLRDVVNEAARKPEARAPSAQPATEREPTHSVGGAILAVSGTFWGGFLGYSLERASGSDDPRLLYPLIGVGAGVGLGAALIVADEWDVGVGEAWYLSAGAWWPAVASQLIYEGRFADNATIPDGEQWAFSLVASATGLGLSAVGLTRRGMAEGGAALAMSGGGAGLILGGLGEFMARGTYDRVPLTGMGYGAMAGWLLGATTAIHISPTATEVFSIDLGALLGTLTGAAAASPLLFSDTTEGRVRGWVGAAAGGMVAGTILAWYLTREEPAAENEEGTEAAAGEPSAMVVRWDLPTPTMLAPAPSLRESAWADRAEAALGHNRPAPAVGLEWRAVLW